MKLFCNTLFSLQAFRFYRLRRRLQTEDIDVELGRVPAGADPDPAGSDPDRRGGDLVHTASDEDGAAIEAEASSSRPAVIVTSASRTDGIAGPRRFQPSTAAIARARRWRALMTPDDSESNNDGLDEWEEIDDDFLIRRSSPAALAR